MTLFKDDDFVREFKEVQQRTHRIAVSKGFWEDREKKNFGEQIALMHSELSEALEANRKSLQSEKIPGFSGEEEELADLLLRIMDTAEGNGLRVAEAALAKMVYNASRPYKHGGKRY